MRVGERRQGEGELHPLTPPHHHPLMTKFLILNTQKTMKTLITLIVLTLFILISPELLTAQPPPGLPDSPNQVPIDGGLALLAAAGGGYAIKKLRDKKKA